MATMKRGLGKGLSALISDKAMVDTMLRDEKVLSNESIVMINIEKIIPKEDQPRKNFNDEALDDLAKSINIHGVIQPIIVRKISDNYEIVAGERRWRASKRLGLLEIPCIVRQISHEDAAKISLIENVQREDLNPIEEASAYKRLMEEYNLKQDELGDAVGKSRSYITNTIRLLNLDERVISHIYNGDLTSGHGKALLGIKDKNAQFMAASRIMELGLNVRETETEVQNTKKATTRKSKQKNKKDNYLLDMEETLMRSLGTKVNLKVGKNKGKIEIEYYDDGDLERLIDLLTN